MDQTTNVGVYNKFIVMWCSEGLEGIMHLTSDPNHDNLVRALTNEPADYTAHHAISSMILRARFNAQRNYEIYSIDAVEGITKQDLEDMFDINPQHAADLIRSRGCKIFSDRAERNKVVIV